MKVNKGFYYWFTLFALCFIAYQQVQDNLRPAYNGHNQVLIYLLGIAPNFFSAIGLPALFIILMDQLRNRLITRLQNQPLVANFISLVGLLGWEFLQIQTSRGFFDWNDVAWTLAGALAFQVPWVITPIEWKPDGYRLHDQPND